MVPLFFPPHPAGTSNNPPRRGAGVLPTIQDMPTVYKDVMNTCRVLMGILKGRVILNAVRIEDYHIGVVAFSQKSPLADLQIRCRKS